MRGKVVVDGLTENETESGGGDDRCAGEEEDRGRHFVGQRGMYRGG